MSDAVFNQIREKHISDNEIEWEAGGMEEENAEDEQYRRREYMRSLGCTEAEISNMDLDKHCLSCGAYGHTLSDLWDKDEPLYIAPKKDRCAYCGKLDLYSTTNRYGDIVCLLCAHPK
jgi:hypothetical protein